MILWFIGGFSVWILCVSFMLAIFKGGKMSHGYEQKLYFRQMVIPQSAEESITEIERECELVLHS